MDGEWSRLTRKAKRWWVAALIVSFVAVGVYGLSTAVGWPLALAGSTVALLAAFAKFNEIAGRIVGGIVVGTLALVGVNVAVDNFVDRVGLPRPPILVGLAFAVVIFGSAAGWYLRGSPGKISNWGRGTPWGLWTTLVTAAALAVFLIVDVPIIVARGNDSIVSILVGLGLGSLLFGLGWWCRLKRERVPVPRRIGGIVGPVIGVLCIAIVPIAREQQKDRGEQVPTRQQVASKVDVRIVTDGSSHPAPEEVTSDQDLRGFDVRYSVGFADGNGVRWTLVDTGSAADALRMASLGRRAVAADAAPTTRENADHVLILLVDGTAPVIAGDPAQLPGVTRRRERVARWRRVAHAAREPGMPIFALVQSERRRRLDRWRNFARGGRVVSLQRNGRRTATDAGLALSIGAPSAQSDLSLAIVHRPVLRFDESEPAPRPLSVEWLFGDGRVFLCRDAGATSTECDDEPTTDPARLENNGTHLELRTPDVERFKELAEQEAAQARGMLAAEVAEVPGAPLPAVPAAPSAPVSADATTPETAIYVHPVPIQRNGRSLLYLDYWWYLPVNPVTVGLKAFCGAGLVIPGITCHDHQSDWEGVTVVVDRTTENPSVLSVQYAQHSDVVAYPWEQLRAYWDTKLKDIVDEAENGAQRPLAFIASGTHSTYPTRCRGNCSQVATRAREDDHGGEVPWIGNFTNACGESSCVHRLPAREGGRQPALWNAFSGAWGEQSCALTYYCDSAEPPPAPGQQERYLHPTRCDGFGDANRKFTPGECDE